MITYNEALEFGATHAEAGVKPLEEHVFPSKHVHEAYITGYDLQIDALAVAKEEGRTLDKPSRHCTWG